MGLLDRIANRAVDRAVDKAVTKTVDKVVDETLGKAVRKTAAEQAEKIVDQETDLAVEALLHCSKCGAVISKKDQVCPSCGAEIEADNIRAVEELEAKKEECKKEIEEEKAEQKEQENKPATQEDSRFLAWLKKKNDTKDTTDEYEKTEIEAVKVLCVFSYLFWLVLIPLFGAKESKFARFHANQGIVLAIVETLWLVLEIVIRALLGGVPVLGALISVVLGLANIVFVVLMIVGILNALNGKAKELPVIGKFKILK